MELPEKGTVKDLVLYRIETAKSDLRTAAMLLMQKEYRAANNRAYYAIFHAITAIHALDGNAYKRHKEVLAKFNKDYDDFYIATREEAQEQIGTAEELILLVEKYCLRRMNE